MFFFSFRFQDQLLVHVLDGQTITINLSAQGLGTTIVTDPSFGPVWDIGPHLSSRKYLPQENPQNNLQCRY